MKRNFDVLADKKRLSQTKQNKTKHQKTKNKKCNTFNP